MPLDGPAQPRPKSAQLARGQRRYRRKVASPKRWQAIIAAKQGPCRVCCDPATNGRIFGHIEFHHVVPRDAPWFGDDVAENIAPLCPTCHPLVTALEPTACRALLAALTDDEYAYCVAKRGEAFFTRAYGLEYRR